MLVHLVSWKLKDEAGGKTRAENAAEMKVRLEALSTKVPSLAAITVSTEILGSTGEFDVVLYSEFADEAALEAYRVHPDHQVEVAFIGSIVESRVAIDYFV